MPPIWTVWKVCGAQCVYVIHMPQTHTTHMVGLLSLQCPVQSFFCWIELEFSCTIPISCCNSRLTTLCTGNRAQVLGILWLKETAPLGHPYSRTQMQRRWRWRLHLLHKWQTDVRDIYANWQLLPAGNRAEARPARGGGSINCRRRQWHICVSESST